ncbi:MAG: hypothetical protein ABG776_05565 [Cyanobacteria bacterium J06555_13]
MGSSIVRKRKKEGISSSILVLFAFATVFFPRLLSYFGIPSLVNFAHFLIVPAVVVIVMFTTKVRNPQQISIGWELMGGMALFLTAMIISAIINNAGWINIFLQFMLQAEPFFFLLAIIIIPFSKKSLQNFRRWLLGFGMANLLLALVQSVLLPIGLYPRKGGTIADNTAGVFTSLRGSAGNYVSCTVSVYFALYFMRCKAVPLWMRVSVLVASLYQVYISDSKQIFLALAAGWILLLFTKVKEPAKLLIYAITIALCLIVFWWALYNFDFMKPYLNWIDRPELYGPNGAARETKLAAFRIVQSHYHTPLNHLFGLGPGHTVTRLGGWMLKKYAAILVPLGATIHPSAQEVFQVIKDGWVAKESTIFFPLFTWAGIWGDIGFVGLGAYLYMSSVAWRRICVDDLGRFMMLSTGILGFILTQMEEPGQMLTVACLLALCWHDWRLQKMEKKYRSLP